MVGEDSAEIDRFGAVIVQAGKRAVQIRYRASMRQEARIRRSADHKPAIALERPGDQPNVQNVITL